MTAFERFTRKINTAGTCWVWTGSIRKDGYGKAFTRGDGQYDRAHVAAYKFFVGPIPSGKVLDHLCRNRRCVRPDHLEPVTIAENVRRGDVGKHNGPRGMWQKAKTHCPKGHEYTPENTRIRMYKGNQNRSCVACKKAANLSINRPSRNRGVK